MQNQIVVELAVCETNIPSIITFIRQVKVCLILVAKMRSQISANSIELSVNLYILCYTLK